MSPHILIIDDDEKICKLIKKLLEREGYDVSYVLNSHQALEICIDQEFDLIITDIMMPEINGKELTTLIREGKSNFSKTIPIIMVSALYEASDRISGIKEGADDYLVKPFEPEELVVRVAALLRRHPPQPKDNVTIINDHQGCILNIKQEHITIHNIPIDLSSNETYFLKMIMESPNTPLDKHEITRQLYPEAINSPESRTAEVMIGRLRKKLEENNCQKIKTKRGNGYYWEV